MKINRVNRRNKKNRNVKIIYDCNIFCGDVYYTYENRFLSRLLNKKEKPMVTEITIGMKDKYWRMTLAHEIGHALHSQRSEYYVEHLMLEDCFNDTQVLRGEIVAWRIARAIIKPKYWKEYVAKRALKSYISLCHITFVQKLNLRKLKIIPLLGVKRKK